MRAGTAAAVVVAAIAGTSVMTRAPEPIFMVIEAPISVSCKMPPIVACAVEGKFMVALPPVIVTVTKLPRGIPTAVAISDI